MKITISSTELSYNRIRELKRLLDSFFMSDCSVSIGRVNREVGVYVNCCL